MHATHACVWKSSGIDVPRACPSHRAGVGVGVGAGLTGVVFYVTVLYENQKYRPFSKYLVDQGNGCKREHTITDTFLTDRLLDKQDLSWTCFS